MLPVELATIGQTAGPSAAHLENSIQIPALTTMPMSSYAAPALPVDAHHEPMMSRETSQPPSSILYQSETGNPVTDQLIGGVYPVAEKVQESYGQDDINDRRPVHGGEAKNTLQTKTRDDITALEEVIRETIEEAIRICDGSIPKAARALDVSPSTIYRRVQSWTAADAKLRTREDEEAA